ncbi:MAG TPA: hypothetical protein PKL99_03080, partial [Syntrophales bacterium]|nr:hypothetical protein [Syntrophales bacterium]
MTEDAFDPLDIHFARFMARLDGGSSTAVPAAALLVSRATRLGHVCFPLAAAAGRPLAGSEGLPGGPFLCPSLASWTALLRETVVAGRPGEATPLVLDVKGRLYLHRYWAYERDLAA